MIDLIGLLKSVRARKKYSNCRIAKAGFTLVELAIVLVIIGLVVGGVLVGKDLISAAEVRAQISQVEKYSAATNTFKVKYNYLPGDMPTADAQAFGFYSSSRNCWGAARLCNGNGQLTGWWMSNAATGESGYFWRDLSLSGLIGETFNTALVGPTVSDITGSDIDKYYPKAKIGNSYVYAYGYDETWISTFYPMSFVGTTRGNYFGLSGVTQINAWVGGTGGGGSQNLGKTTLSVSQAYNIDSKIDDGLPKTGKVIAAYLNGQLVWVDGTAPHYGSPNNGAIPASATTCYDNANVANSTQKYSTAQNSGNGINCALSFKFQ